MLLSEGQMNDHKGARLMLDALPPAKELIGDPGDDSDGFRAALEDHGIEPCIPWRRHREVQHPYDAVLYRQRHHV